MWDKIILFFIFYYYLPFPATKYFSISVFPNPHPHIPLPAKIPIRPSHSPLDGLPHFPTLSWKLPLQKIFDIIYLEIRAEVLNIKILEAIKLVY